MIEYAHSSIKRLRMVGDTLRLRDEQVRDRVMVVAYSLHNLRIVSPYQVDLAPAHANFGNSFE
ncbi:MAG: hypothetical protein ACRYG7_42735 [Janthinobacterium lividum]